MNENNMNQHESEHDREHEQKMRERENQGESEHDREQWKLVDQAIGDAEQRLIEGWQIYLDYCVENLSLEQFEDSFPQNLTAGYAYYVLDGAMRACLLSDLEKLQGDFQVIATTQAEWARYRESLFSERQRVQAERKEQQQVQDEWNKRAVFKESDAQLLSDMGIAPIDPIVGFRSGELAELVKRISRHAPPVVSGTEKEVADMITDSFERLSPAEQETARREMYAATTGKEVQPRKSFDLSAGDIEWLLDLNAYDLEENAASMWFQHLIRRRVLRGAPFAREHEERVRSLRVGYPF